MIIVSIQTALEMQNIAVTPRSSCMPLGNWSPSPEATWPVLEFDVKGFIQYVLFCVWLCLLNMVFWNTSILSHLPVFFLFIHRYYFLVWIYYRFFIVYPCVGRYLRFQAFDFRKLICRLCSSISLKIIVSLVHLCLNNCSFENFLIFTCTFYNLDVCISA